MYVVGTFTKNCEDTIGNVVKTIDEGLNTYFPGGENVIVVSDAFSDDNTKEVALNTHTRAEKLWFFQEGENGPGKGIGVKTAFEVARDKKAEGVALIDGDLTSIKPEWINKLLIPIKEGYDEVIPLYLRHPYDGVITNQLAYPLTAVLYGKEIRQPIGGEFSLSNRALDTILKSPLFPEKFGIDIFLSTTGVAEDLKITEAVLGFKEHTSTKEYKDPMKLLVPMFYQVVRMLFELYCKYKSRAKGVNTIQKVERKGEIPKGAVKSFSVDKTLWFKQIKNDFRENIGDISNIDFLSSIKEEIEPYLKKEHFTLPLELWAKCVFLALNNYSKDKQKTLDILKVFWEARYMGLVEETENLPQEEAERRIQDQIKVFWKYRNMLTF
jgi:glycosyltransferase involved in cell wall biosynthesis